MEKQLRLTAEIVTNRKSRSLFSGAKRWFGANKPAGSGGGTSVVYSREAPELQVSAQGTGVTSLGHSLMGICGCEALYVIAI